MSIFKIKADKLKLLTVNEILFRIFGMRDVQEWIVETTKKRIKSKGIDSFGSKLQTDIAKEGFSMDGAYSEVSEFIRSRTGIQFSHVDLDFTGAFMSTWKVNARKRSAKISANFKKKGKFIGEIHVGGHIGFNFMDSYESNDAFESAILGLSESEKRTLNQKIVLPKLLQILKNA